MLFAPASSNVHSEWSVIDEYVFVRCGNPLHRNHRIIRKEAASEGLILLPSLLDSAQSLVDGYEEVTAGGRALAAVQQ